MEDMGNNFKKWREWRNTDLDSKSSMPTKGAEKKKSTNQPKNQQINRLNVKLFQRILAFQQAFSNFSTLFPNFCQVSCKFPTVLFHSLVVKSSIFFINFSILANCKFYSSLSSFQEQYCFHSQIQCLLQQFQHSSCKYSSNLSTFSIVLFHSFLRKSNTFLQQLIPIRFSFVRFPL